MTVYIDIYVSSASVVNGKIQSREKPKKKDPNF